MKSVPSERADASRQSASTRDVALSALESSSQYLPNVRVAVERTAGLLRAGRIEEGNRIYAQLLDALGVLVFAMSAAGEQLREVGAPLGSASREARESVDGLLEAQQRCDWVRIADRLEYEVVPLLGVWDERIRDVRRRAGGSHARTG